MNGNSQFGPLVSVNWLDDHLHDSKLLIFDASMNKVSSIETTYSTLQIPTSQFFDIKNVFSDVNAIFPNTVPSESKFSEEARKLGVNSDSYIVVYDDKGIYSSARAWYLFKAFGFQNVAVLNGGLPKWKSVGYKLEKRKVQQIKEGNFTAVYDASKFKFFDDIQKSSNNENYLIIDARSEDRFKGILEEPRKDLRSGSIPNSVNIPYSKLLDGGSYKSIDSIQKEFNKINAKNQHLVFTCGSGVTACVLALGAELIGKSNNSVYDGSWTEYGTLTKK